MAPGVERPLTALTGSVPEYAEWSQEQLVTRVTELEQLLLQSNLHAEASHQPSGDAKGRQKPKRPFNFSRYSTRFIALKFAYLGHNYSGYEHHLHNHPPKPTIEEVLWKALRKTQLIAPPERAGGSAGDVNWEGCDYTKSGRTDAGVSAFGQVIGIRVRSNRPLPSKLPGDAAAEHETAQDLPEHDGDQLRFSEADTPSNLHAHAEGLSEFDHIVDEIPYVDVLNRVLPTDIRMIAWCPNPPDDFSARFSCKQRQYRYYFTQPAFASLPGRADAIDGANASELRQGWLDIDAMRTAAAYFVGSHDFRNYCKIDAAKQISNYERRIYYADIEEHGSSSLPEYFNRIELPSDQQPLMEGHQGDKSSATWPATRPADEGTKIYSFTVHGSAFLWHQVRHMVAILFLVGQRLESPSVVRDLLDVQKTPSRPFYELAEDAPLVLYQCNFPEDGGDANKDGLEWLYGSAEATKEGRCSALPSEPAGARVISQMWQLWHRSKVYEIITAGLLDLAAANISKSSGASLKSALGDQSSIRIFDGGDKTKRRGEYKPVLERPKLDHFETVNGRFRQRRAEKFALNLGD